jgi:hypothetical protein
VAGNETTESDTDNEDVSENSVTINTPAHGIHGQGGDLSTWKLVLC